MVGAQDSATAGQSVLENCAGPPVVAQCHEVGAQMAGKCEAVRVVYAQNPTIAGEGVLVEIAPGSHPTRTGWRQGCWRERGPANLIQGLRDFFGAHTYQRIDDEGYWHTRWAQDGEEMPAGGQSRNGASGAISVPEDNRPAPGAPDRTLQTDRDARNAAPHR